MLVLKGGNLMGIISEYRVTDNSEYLLSGGKSIRQIEKYTLEIEIKELTYERTKEILKIIELEV